MSIMNERVRSASVYRCPAKMESDLSPRKTMMVLVIVVGCFAVLWPKVFYPMMVGSADQHIKPSPIDKAAGCCDVISETDVTAVKIVAELCGPAAEGERPQELVRRCRAEVLATCGIDIAAALQGGLGGSVRRILGEVRSPNGSLCLERNYGVAPWSLGVPHRMGAQAPNVRQERPLHLRSELIHPAFRERGRAIPRPQPAPPSRPASRVIDGRPGPVPGMRPTIGGAGHVVPPSKQGTSSMSVIMPIYTIGIVIFFTYTLMRIIFKKQPEGVGGSLYPPLDSDPHFRKEVFEGETGRSRMTRESISSKLVVNAMSALLDEVDQELEARRKSNEVTPQDLVNGNLSNGDVVKSQEGEEQPTVKVLGMEMTASCEGGKKWSRPGSPVLPSPAPPAPAEPVPPPQEIYLEGALPPQSQLLVADSATESQPTTDEDPAVVLSGKMTLSVISLDSENGADEGVDKSSEVEEPVPEVTFGLEEQIEEAIQERKEEEIKAGDEIEEPEFEIEEYEVHQLIIEKFEASPPSKIQVEDLERNQTAVLSEEKVEHVMQKPLIQLESDEVSQTVRVEELEKEVEELIQQAIENIENREDNIEELKEADNVEVFPNDESIKTQNSEEKTKIEGSVEKIYLEASKLDENSSEVVKITEDKPDTVQVPQTIEETKPSSQSTERVESKHKEVTVPAEISETIEKTTITTEETPSQISKVEGKEVEEKTSTDSSVKSGETLPQISKTEKVEEQTSIVKTEEIENTTVPESEEKYKPEPVETEEKRAEEQAVKAIPESEPSVKPTEEKQIEDDEELGSDEEVVEEIEEIVYEEETEEEESDEELARITDTSPAPKVNGDRSEDVIEESKYASVSGPTAAEYDISDEELTDNEDEEEILDIEEEADDDDYAADESNDVNHVSGESEPKL